MKPRGYECYDLDEVEPLWVGIICALIVASLAVGAFLLRFLP